MSRRMSLWWTLTLCVAWSLSLVTSVLADPPQAEPAPPVPVDRAAAQIRIEAMIYEVDPAKLAKLADQTKSPVAELLKLNGFKLLDESKNQGLPLVHAVGDQPLKLDINKQDVSLAFKRISAPKLMTLSGQEANVITGGQFPVPVPQPGGETQTQWRDFGTKLGIKPIVEPDGRLLLDVLVEESQLGEDTGVEIEGVRIPSLRARRMSLAAKLKSGQYLLIASGTTESDLTQFVQLKVETLTPTESARRDAAGQSTLREPRPALTSSKTHGPLVEPDHRTRTVLFQVRVYEIDHEAWATDNVVEKKTKQFDELLKPFAGGWRGAKLVSDGVRAWATKTPISEADVAKLTPAVRLISEPQLAVLDGEMLRFDYGGRTPQIELTQRHGNSTQRSGSGTHLRPLATTFGVQSQVTDVGRVQLAVHYMANRDLKKSQITLEDLKTRASVANAELSVGQTLCLTDAKPDSSDRSDALLVTVTPAEIQINEQAKPIAPVAKVAEPTEKMIVVEDRWPLGEIKVGQRVVPIPVSVEKTCVSAHMLFVCLFGDTPSLPKVVAVEAAKNSIGRRVTVSLPPSFSKIEEPLRTTFLDQLETAMTTVVIPASRISPTDFYEGRILREIVEQIPMAQRPRPVELAIGETTTLIGVAGLIATSQPTGTKKELGSFELELLDDDAGGFWNAKATRQGLTRVVQMMIEAPGPARLTDYLVKADTRELEHHIREQFPTAQVTITSVGTNSLLLRGTVGSDEDSRGIAELAEQFAPNILNRLKVGTTEAGAEPRTMGTPARPIVEQTDTPQAVDEPIFAKPITAGSGKSAQPPRVQPASATSPKKNDQLRELLDEIRELRREVRLLNERLEREQSQRTQKAESSKASSPLGQQQSATEATEFDKLVAQYNELMDQKRFAEAEVVGKQAKELDPRNPAAEVMMLKAVLARRMAHEKQQQTSSNNVPLHNPEWERASSASHDPVAIGITAAEREAVVKLHRKVELEAVDLPLRKAVQQLSASADINMVLDKLGLEEAGVSESMPVTRTLKEVSLRSALKIVLEPLQLGYVFDGEILKITSRARAEGPAVVVAYPVADLLGTDTDNELARLRDLITVTVRGEAEWNGGVHNSPRIHGDRATKSLVVRHTSAVQAEVATVLELLRMSKRMDVSSNEATTTHLSDEERRISAKLQTKISVKFETAPLKDVLTHIAKQIEINIVVDSAGLEDEGLKTTTPVSLSLDNVRTSSALRLLLEPLRLDYVVQNDVLRVTSHARAEGELAVASYPVADFIGDVADVEGTLSNLSNLLTSMVEPNSWEEVGGNGRVKASAPTQSLIVRQTRSNHARIRELLETLRKMKDH